MQSSLNPAPFGPSRRKKAPAERLVADPLLDLHEVKQLSGLGKTAIYAGMKAGTFPKALKPAGSTSSRWLESEVMAWRESLKRIGE